MKSSSGRIIILERALKHCLALKLLAGQLDSLISHSIYKSYEIAWLLASGVKFK